MEERAGFGAVLARLREAAGFPTPYAFYRSRDGRRSLSISFANYLKLERGESLPQAKRLEPLLAALGLEAASPQAKALVRAYLRSVLGSGRLLDLAAGPAAADPAPPSWALAERAARQAVGQRKAQLSLEQYRTVCGDAAAYSCHVVLANTKAWMSLAELARLTGRPAAAVGRALGALAAVGLAELAGGKARSPLAGMFIPPPAVTPLTASVFAALQRHRRAWDARPVQANYLVLRARKDSLTSYLPHLSDAVNLSAIYGDVSVGEGSGFYLVEARVSEVFS